MANLKPCPFCGSENVIISYWGLWRCWCQECLAKTSDKLREKDAIEAWNNRTDNSDEIRSELVKLKKSYESILRQVEFYKHHM